MITPEKLKVYDSCSGDENTFARVGADYQIALFADNDDWRLIREFYQDISEINDWLVSQAYAEKSIVNMRKHCDAECFEIFMSKLIA